MDIFTRECLAIEPGARLSADDVVRILNKIATKHGVPESIYCDNGCEFSGCLVDLWAYSNQVILGISWPGKPTDNAVIELFNGSLRDECLNVHWFDDLTDAKKKMQTWLNEYNESRPHKALNNLSSLEFAVQ